MYLHEAIKKVQDKEYKFLVFDEKKYILLDSGFLEEYYGNEFHISSAKMLSSDEWTVEEEILPENVYRCAKDDKLYEIRTADIWINIYRHTANSKIKETIFESEADARNHSNCSVIWTFIKTIYLSQQYSVLYEKVIKD